ncbi:MAG: hypothetical protein MJ077_01315 [Oscillospiraceae bacterium]|nr:hypothetical protein [Oscillospiraceae bacterium]
MKKLLETACQQADEVIAAAIGRPCPVKSRLSPRGTIANPTPRALRLDGEGLLTQQNLSHTWLESVTCQGGFFNFTLREAWFHEAAQHPLEWEELPPLPPVSIDFPAAIHPGDWVFAGKKASPERCARQDEGNPGWLVRVTEERLRTLENRAETARTWTPSQKALLLRLAAYDESASTGRLTAYLTDLSRLIWQEKPHRLPAELNRCCQAVIHNGRAVIYRKFILSEIVGVK